MLIALFLFFMGVIEMLVGTIWTKVVTENQVFASGFVTMINVFIWYYVLQALVANVNNWFLALLYALGCAVGTMAGIFYFRVKGKKVFRELQS